MNDDEWLNLIRNAKTLNAAPVKMFTYRGKSWTSWSSPVALASEDGTEFVVKSPRVGAPQARAIVTEQIVASIGAAINAPVSDVYTVEIAQDLIDANAPTLNHLGVGVSHGSKRIQNASDRAWLDHIDEPLNRSRFASIAVLYGWTMAHDHQLIYELTPPHHVYSVDHGLFFNGSQNWNVTTLAGGMAAATFDAQVMTGCKITPKELRPAIENLKAVDAATIARAVSRPPDTWGITEAERLAAAKYLSARQEKLVAQAP